MPDQLKDDTRLTPGQIEVGETGDAQASLTPEVGTGTAQGQPVLPALTPDQVRQIQAQADHNVPCYGQLLTRILTSHEALRTELAQAQQVWSELSVIASCTSPDGSAELEQVKYAYERASEAEAKLAQVEQERNEAQAKLGRAVLEYEVRRADWKTERIKAEADLAALKSAYDELKRAVDPKDVIVGRHGIATFASELYQSHLELTALKARLTAESLWSLIRELTGDFVPPNLKDFASRLAQRLTDPNV